MVEKSRRTRSFLELNLTAASHVIHYDLWWNPAVGSQANDRAYRVRQKNNVMVHGFITKNTFGKKDQRYDPTEKSIGRNDLGNRGKPDRKSKQHGIT